MEAHELQKREKGARDFVGRQIAFHVKHPEEWQCV